MVVQPSQANVRVMFTIVASAGSLTITDLSHPRPPVDGNHQHKHVNLILVLLLLAAIFLLSQNSPGLISISQMIPRNAGTIGTQDTTSLPFFKTLTLYQLLKFTHLFTLKIIINRVNNISNRNTVPLINLEPLCEFHISDCL